jgi:mannose-6-phosphate isomerase-like protein (cupin superfamily)
MNRTLLVTFLIVLAAASALGQDRKPSIASKPFVVRTKQKISDIQKTLEAKPGNTNEDVVASAGGQMRVAIFHDEKRVDDNVEVHDSSDDIYYVLKGTATLMLGGSLDAPKEVSPGEWRAKMATGGQKVVITKGDLIVVPRGTPHQRTVTDKKFSMILVKVFSVGQPTK